MSRAVEIRVEKRRLDAFNNEVHAGMHVLGRLREAGVPVLGSLFVLGVSAGTLTCEFDDLGLEEYVWRWQP